MSLSLSRCGHHRPKLYAARYVCLSKNCWHVLDIYRNSAHYFERRSPVASKAFAAHQTG